MRKLIRWTLAPMALVALACGKDNSHRPTAMRDDLKRDLQLASAQPTIQISPDEIAPKATPEPARNIKRAPTGPRVIRTTHKPTVKASVTETQVAEAPEEVLTVQMMPVTPDPSETPAPDNAPPLTRPGVAPVDQHYPGAQPVPEPTGSAAGTVLGGIFGAVIRGGVVGDDDHCDPRGMPRGGRPIGGGSYYPSPTTGIAGSLPGRVRPRF